MKPHANAPVSTVSMHVRQLLQLFNSLDPAPFWDRDLDPAAATFIEQEFSDRRRDRHWVLEVTTAETGELSARDVQQAIKVYYERMAMSASKRLREKLWIGQWALLVGVGVFVLCMVTLQSLQQRYAQRAPQLLAEGLVVLAWVAIWIPVEQLFYDLAPLLRERRFFRRLSLVRVHLRSAAASAPADARG